MNNLKEFSLATLFHLGSQLVQLAFQFFDLLLKFLRGVDCVSRLRIRGLKQIKGVRDGVKCH